MAHKTFFSFHYERDVQRASVVRKSSQFKSSITPEWIERPSGSRRRRPEIRQSKG